MSKFFSFFKSQEKKSNGNSDSVKQEAVKEAVMASENKEEEKSQKAKASESQSTPKASAEDKGQTSQKQRIYNLIIVDESGSMSGLRDVTVSGINETINTIREAQKEYENVQEHYITLVTFDERNDRSTPAIRTLMDAVPAHEANDFMDYRPMGCTPLYDAMGQSLTNLRDKIAGDEDATGIVTVLTDGLENASHMWRADALRKLIEQLKEQGWTFSYMGSAHNVKEVTDLLSIDNVVEFSHDVNGARHTWARDRSSKMATFCRMANDYDFFETREEKMARKRRYSQEYYSGRVTRDNIDSLNPDEVFVFGSDRAGQHTGGAARIAMNLFGAQWGVGEGLQGQSYAIPTTEGFEYMREAVHRFCIYARQHREQKFLVTRIGCGTAGYAIEQVAQLFEEAIELENVSLPKEFWDVLGLNMTF